MNVDFLRGQKKDERPAPAPPAQPHPAQTQPAATQVASAKPATTEPVTEPTPSAASEPVTVYWTGELNVTPLATAATRPSTAPAPTTSPADEPLAPGEGRVELLGSPVVLTRDLLDVRTGRFVYKTN